MSNEIGTAYLGIVASTSGMAKDIRKALGDAVPGGNEAGKKTGSGFAKGLAKGAAVVGAGVLVGKTISLGMQRAISIEGAQKKLEGLGHTSKSITSIMGSALKSVRGTAYGLGDAASVAAMMAAAGVKNGKEMTATLSTVADVAAISGRSLTDIGTIFGSVAARGKLQGDDMLQLMSSGVPVLQMLAKQTGKTSAEVSKMVSKGQIDFATFAAAMDAGMGGAAKRTGETFPGAVANANAALGRLGAAFMSPALEAAKPVLAGVTSVIDALTAKVGPLAEAWGAKLVPAAEAFGGALTALAGGAKLSDVFPSAGPVLELLGALSPLGLALKALAPLFPQLGDAAKRILAALAPLLPVVTAVASRLGGVLADALLAIVPTLLPQLTSAIVAVVAAFVPVLPVVAQVAGELAGPLAAALIAVAGIVPTLLPAVAAVARFTAGLLANKPVLYAIIGAFAGFKVVSTFVRLLSGAKTAITVVKGAMVALNVAMRANPIGLVVTAVAALVAGLYSFFTQTEVGRQAWATFMSWLSSAWTVLSAGASAAWSAITGGVQAAASWVSGAWTSTVSTVTGAWAAVTGFFSGLWSGIVSGAQAGWATFTAVIRGSLALILPIISAPLKVWGALFKAAWETIKTIVAAAFLILHSIFTGNFSAIGGIVTAAWAKIKSIFANAFASIKSAVSSALASVKTIFSTAWSAIKSTVSSAWSAIKSAVSAGISAVVGLVRQLPAKAAGALVTLESAIKAKVVSAWEAAKGAVRTGVAAAVTLVRELPGKAAAALAGLGSRLVSAGSDLVRGFVQGIKNGISWVADAARNLAESAVRSAKSALGIASPSKVFKGIAGWVVKGFTGGIGQGLPEVKASIAKMGDAVTKAGEAAIKAEAKRLQAARRKANDDIKKANKSRGKGVKAKPLLPALNLDDATKQAKKNLAVELAGLDILVNGFAKHQSTLTKTLWDDGKYQGGVKRWKGLNQGTVALLEGLKANGKVRADASQAVQRMTLADIGKAQGQITAAIDAAKATLEEMKAAAAQLASSVSSSLMGELDLGSAVSEDGTATAASVMGVVSGLAAKVKRFAGLLKDLAGKGMPTGLLQEVASLGTAKGIPVAEALKSASSAEVKALSSDWASLGSWAGSAGKTVADSMYKVGIDAQQGLVDGLMADSAKLKAASKVLAEGIVKQVKTTLGIKSPSRVLKAVGGFAVEGLRIAMNAGRKVIAKASDQLAAAAIPDLSFGADLDEWARAKVQAEASITAQMPQLPDLSLLMPDTGPTRLAREDLAFLGDYIIRGLLPAAQAAAALNDIKANGPSRQRRGPVRGV